MRAALRPEHVATEVVTCQPVGRGASHRLCEVGRSSGLARERPETVLREAWHKRAGAVAKVAGRHPFAELGTERGSGQENGFDPRGSRTVHRDGDSVSPE